MICAYRGGGDRPCFLYGEGTNSGEISSILTEKHEIGIDGDRGERYYVK